MAHPIDVYYIVAFASQCAHRRRAFAHVASWLRAYNASRATATERVRLVVVGTEPVVGATLVALRPAATFSRARAFNAATRHVCAERRRAGADARSCFFIFADADVVMRDEDLARCVRDARRALLLPDAACHTRHLVVNPFDQLVDTPPPHRDGDGDDDGDDGAPRVRAGLSFSSAMLGLSDAALRAVGGWDDTYVGWGYEDAAMDARIYERYARTPSPPSHAPRVLVRTYAHTATHLWHPIAHERTLVVANRERYERRYGVHVAEHARRWFARQARRDAAARLHASRRANSTIAANLLFPTTNKNATSLERVL